MKKFLAATLCMFVVAACAMGGSKRAARTEAPTMAPASTGGASSDMASMSPKQQLEELYAQVEKDRETMRLPEPAAVQPGSSAVPMATQPLPTSSNDATCKPARNDACETSCTLSDSICTNATSICRLADELKPDDDAAAKCTKATDTCKTAHTKCCGCM